MGRARVMDWMLVFDEVLLEPGASDDDIARFVATIAQPLSAEEVEMVNRTQRNPFHRSDPLHATYKQFDPSVWVMPTRPLPPQYLSLLKWSNGAWCRSGEREFGFFPTFDANGCGVRDSMLAYHVPQYMPGALPFAFNGGGTFYLFDMREDAVGGEYPVVCCHAGSLSWDWGSDFVVAASFEEACRDKVNVEELRP